MNDQIGGLGNGASAQPALIKDSTIETFEADVIHASMNQPVIVDFWATWCGPCKQLTPALEAAVTQAAGKVLLVKVDIDQNKMLASQMRVQSVPTVYGFFQGRPVDGFQGAIPGSEIKGFIDRLIAMAGQNAGPEQGIEEFVAAATNAFEAGDVTAAAQIYAQILQIDQTNADALIGLARCHVALGDFDQARQTLEMVAPEGQKTSLYQSVSASIELAANAGDASELGKLAAAAQADPENLDKLYALADAQIGAGQAEQAMDLLLDIIGKDLEWNDQAARKKLLTIFDALGPKHAATLRGRRRLSSLLFS